MASPIRNNNCSFPHTCSKAWSKQKNRQIEKRQSLISLAPIPLIKICLIVDNLFTQTLHQYIIVQRKFFFLSWFFRNIEIIYTYVLHSVCILYSVIPDPEKKKHNQRKKFCIIIQLSTSFNTKYPSYYNLHTHTMSINVTCVKKL